MIGCLFKSAAECAYLSAHSAATCHALQAELVYYLAATAVHPSSRQSAYRQDCPGQKKRSRVFMEMNWQLLYAANGL